MHFHSCSSEGAAPGHSSCPLISSPASRKVEITLSHQKILAASPLELFPGEPADLLVGSRSGRCCHDVGQGGLPLPPVEALSLGTERDGGGGLLLAGGQRLGCVRTPRDPARKQASQSGPTQPQRPRAELLQSPGPLRAACPPRHTTATCRPCSGGNVSASGPPPQHRPELIPDASFPLKPSNCTIL